MLAPLGASLCAGNALAVTRPAARLPHRGACAGSCPRPSLILAGAAGDGLLAAGLLAAGDSAASGAAPVPAGVEAQAQPIHADAGCGDEAAGTGEPVAPRAATGVAGEGPQPEASAASPAGTAFALTPALLRRAAGSADANEALDVLAAELSDGRCALTEDGCQALIAAALERGNVVLARSVFAAMSVAAAAAGRTSAGGSAAGVAATGSNGGQAPAWPPSSTATAAALVIGLARALRTREAVAVIDSVRSRGLPTSDDVHFGHVVRCPLAVDAAKPLAVVPPEAGVQQVADSYSRYEYELYSGTVAAAASESLAGGGSWAAAAARGAGLLRGPEAGAVHTLLVTTPAGQQRSFRFATATPDVPAKAGDRVTLVCCPQHRPQLSQRRLLSSSPPGAKPGEAMSLSNHTTRGETQLLRPPAPAGTRGLPQWALPAVMLLAASDAATSLIDPALPYLAAGAAVAAAAAGVAGSTLLLPRLKRLPEEAVEVAAVRQRLLGQHSQLQRRLEELVGECVADVRALAKLWQLQSKMGAVAAGSAYDARLDRVAAARSGVEERLRRAVGLVDAYARVLSMIEIEVEVEAALPAAEMLGLEAQILRLSEVEELQAEWRLQAEAQDEVERLLRADP